MLHFGRNEALFATSKPNTDPPTTPNLESDYEPLHEPIDGHCLPPGGALRQKVLGKPAKIYLLPRPYLVKEDLTSASVMHMCDGSLGDLASTKLLFLHSRKGYNSP